MLNIWIYIFLKCTSLKHLDISNFNALIITEDNINLIFDYVNSLKYINLYNARINDNDNIKSKIRDILQDSVTLCKNNDIVANTEEKTFIYECCDYNLETSSCDTNNYIKVKYTKDVTYSYGFNIIEYDKSENQYRSYIYLINSNNKRYKPNETLIIKEYKNKNIFKFIIHNFRKFFYDYYESNVENIISIDLTNFDSSLKKV